jgi:hypothetical protein
MAGLRLCLKWLLQTAGYYVVWSQSSHQEVSRTGDLEPQFGRIAPAEFELRGAF